MNDLLMGNSNSDGPKKTILIIGAGGYGHVVAEIAESIGYHSFFLDDHHPKAIGKISELEEHIHHYDVVFVAIGNNVFRKQITEKIREIGSCPVTLIHPTAYVSPSATVGAGTVIAPRAVVNTRSSIGEGCILSVGAIVDHDAVVESFVHLDAGSVCKPGSHIESCCKIDAGTVAAGY